MSVPAHHPENTARARLAAAMREAHDSYAFIGDDRAWLLEPDERVLESDAFAGAWAEFEEEYAEQMQRRAYHMEQGVSAALLVAFEQACWSAFFKVTRVYNRVEGVFAVKEPSRRLMHHAWNRLDDRTKYDYYKGSHDPRDDQAYTPAEQAERARLLTSEAHPYPLAWHDLSAADKFDAKRTYCPTSKRR